MAPTLLRTLRIWNHHRCHRYYVFYYSSVRGFSPRVRVKINRGNYNYTYRAPSLGNKAMFCCQDESGTTRQDKEQHDGSNERSNNLCLVAIVPWKPELRGERRSGYRYYKGKLYGKYSPGTLHANRTIELAGMLQILLPGKEPGDGNKTTSSGRTAQSSAVDRELTNDEIRIVSNNRM
jgi:hypothetical protein